MDKRTASVWAAVGAVVALVGGLGYKVYTLTEAARESEQQRKLVIAEKDKKLRAQQEELDSIRLATNGLENDSAGGHFSNIDNEAFQRELQANAERVKQQMIQEYESFVREAERLKQRAGKQNKALRAKLEKEQQRTQALLEELRQTQATDTEEITRLRAELANLREILRSYVAQVDELNRKNQALHEENQSLRTGKASAEQQAAALATEKAALTEKVAIASQLDATGVSARALNKKGKTADKVKETKKIEVRFTLARNVTAQTGSRTVYIRILTPTGATLTQGGTFTYENRSLEYSIRREIEYTGEETPATCYWTVSEALTAGTYRADIFADGHNIGGATFALR